jgi:amidase
MARSVADAAILLATLAGADARDAATAAADDHLADYAAELRRDGLYGARIGIARNFVGFNPAVDVIMEYCIAKLCEAGAEVVDPVDVPHVKELAETELEVLLYEFHADLDAYLASHEPYRRMVHAANDVDVNRVVTWNPFIKMARVRVSTALLVPLAHDRRHLWQARQVLAQPDFPRT